MIDAFNFLANQSGLVIDKLELTQVAEVAPPEPLVDPSISGLVAGGDLLDASGCL